MYQISAKRVVCVVLYVATKRSAADKTETEQLLGVSSTLTKHYKKATGDCIVFQTQDVAGSHRVETVIALLRSLLNVFVDGEIGASASFMIDFSLFDC